MNVNSYIADGFMQDCEELIHTLTNKYKKVDWHQFCHQWKEKHFDTVFYGRQSGAEVVEFTEEALQCARLYFVTETDNYEEQVVGLFIAYALLVIQPYKNLSAFRLIPLDVEPIMKFKTIAILEGRRDVLMILGKVLIYGPTQFHVCVRERAMDSCIRKYFDGSTNVPLCILRRWHGILGSSRVKGFRHIGSLESKYAEMKRSAKHTSKTLFPDTNIEENMVKNVGIEIAESLQNLVNGATVNIKSQEVPEETPSVSVKRRAMKKTVNPVGHHLHGVNERKQFPRKPVVCYSSGRRKTKHKEKKEPDGLSLPEPLADGEKPFVGFSLPGSDELCRTHGDLPEDEVPFRGFSSSALETLEQEVLTRVKAETLKVEANDGKSVEGDKSSDEGKPADMANSYEGSTFKLRDVAFAPVKKRSCKKKPVKNKNNRKIRLFDFSSDESDTDESSETVDVRRETPTPPPPPPPRKVYKRRHSVTKQNKTVTIDGVTTRELTIQTKGQPQQYIDVQFKDMPIVIRTEKETQPFEIEIIDKYIGDNLSYEEVCKLGDGEENKRANKVDVGNEPARSVDLTRDGNIETCHFEIISYEDEEPKKVPAVRNENVIVINDLLNAVDSEKKKFKETVKKVLSQQNAKPFRFDRRNLKQPTLRSKLKKMGILSLASFEDDSD